ncbi:HNH endonuclease [bacterium]|nr:HNH endonuclease [bacterium]
MVVERAKARCEYCLVHEDYAVLVHEIDHVIATKHGGETLDSNLAYACAQCNRFKGSDIASVDPETGAIVPLFNPRADAWSNHFVLDGPVISPLTAIARATERLLQLNQIDRILLRKELLSTGRYPY